jgi:hypothetical protein
MNDIGLDKAKFSEMEGEDWSPIFGHVENVEVELMGSKNITDDC